jgi:hypothetical protein
MPRVSLRAHVPWLVETEMAGGIFRSAFLPNKVWLSLPGEEAPLYQPVGVFLFFRLNEIQSIHLKLRIPEVERA